MPHAPDYDPATYWNEKARRADRDPFLASCGGDPHENACMHRAQVHAIAQAVERIGREAPFAGRRLLDFGCGAGRWTQTFRQLGVDYTGVDISDEMIAICRHAHPHARFSVMDGLSLPFPDASFDVVCSIAVIHHNRELEQEMLLAEITRVLRPGGHLFLFEACGRTANPRIFPRSVREWERLLVSRRYRRLHRRHYDYYVLTDLVRRVVWKLRLPLLRDGRRPPALLALDAKVSPWLSRVVRFGTDVRVALVFRREG